LYYNTRPGILKKKKNHYTHPPKKHAENRIQEPGVVVHICNPRRWRQEDHKFKASPAYMVKPSLEIKPKQ
jgi:hypothetical protein